MEVSPFQDKKSGLRQFSNDASNFRIACRCQFEATPNGVTLERVNSQASRNSSSQAIRHRNDVVLVPDYQMVWIKLLDDRCTLPELAAVGTIIGPKRQREVVIGSPSRAVSSFVPRPHEIYSDERLNSHAGLVPSIGIETNRDSPVLRGVKHTLHSSLNKISPALSFHQFWDQRSIKHLEHQLPFPWW